MNEERAPRDDHGRAKLHADVAHPINARARDFVQSGIIKAFEEEIERSKQPGYVCQYDLLDAGAQGYEPDDQAYWTRHGSLQSA